MCLQAVAGEEDDGSQDGSDPLVQRIAQALNGDKAKKKSRISLLAWREAFECFAIAAHAAGASHCVVDVVRPCVHYM